MEARRVRTRTATVLLLSLLMALLLPVQSGAEVRYHAFPNRLSLNHVKVDRAPVFTLTVTVWVGSVNEDPKKNGGVSHLLEHILFHQPDMPEKEFNAQIESLGGTYNGRTADDYTQYHVTVPAQRLDLGQQWLHKVLFHDRPVTDRLAEEKEIVNRENGWSAPTWWDRLWTFLRPEHLKLPGLWEHQFGLPEYDHPAGGTYEVASRLTAAQLEAHYRAYYYPENMFLLYAGPHELDEVIATLSPTFGKVPPTGKRANLASPLDSKPPRPYFSHKLPGAFRLEPGFFWYPKDRIAIGHVFRGFDSSQLTLYQFVLEQLLQDRLRYKAGKTYSVSPHLLLHRGAGFLWFDLEAGPDTYWTQLKEVKALVWGNLGEHLSETDYERYKTTLLERLSPNGVHYEQIWKAIYHDPLHRPDAEETVLRSLSYQEFLDWVRTWRGQTAPLLELSMPAFPFPYVHILAFALSLGLGMYLARSFFRRPFPRESIRLITRVPYGVLRWIQLGLSYVVAAVVYFHLSWATEYGTLFFSRVNTLALLQPYLDWTLKGFLFGLCLALGGLFMPRKVLVTDRALLVKSRSPFFFRVPLGDIQSVEWVSGWTALREIVRLRALPAYPWFRRGLLIRRRSGLALALHTRDDRELLELLSSPKPWEPIDPEVSTIWASQVAGDGNHNVAVLGEDPEEALRPR